MRLLGVTLGLGVAMLLALSFSFSCSVGDLTAGDSLVDAAAEEPSGSSGGLEGGPGAVLIDARGGSEAGGCDPGGLALDASSWPAPTSAVALENAFNQRYLDVPCACMANGAQVVTSSPTGALNQLWTIMLQTDGSYEIWNQLSGKCLDDPGGLSSPGTSLQQYQCWLPNNYNQRWYLVDYCGALYIVGEQSGLCLTATQATDSSAVTLFRCTQSQSQQWIIPN